ncbi:SDR family NAD(P)-dependent oxidoreductase [Sphingobium sp. DEHP117]|uniref:SDR family NAD(P)-dependent oxidoreductase n=1 Tax=Sphingobium sp. DEHP117 TaxID=2993436 RepID=UPI0027D60218|nr:SDR family NAD(P)-dependent oxidoreductase [Sphingobium sp. DEHP117]MDQ4420328.1 SDR family NAD(P)-dependent oxidoreductase [Sphingobium sp. DEHP117]
MGDDNNVIRFDGQVAVVSGAGGGLGAAYAKDLARRGACVVVNDLAARSAGEPNPADVVAEEIRASGGRAVAANFSCAVRAGGDAIIDCAVKNFGRVDVLVHNAGFLRNGPFEQLSETAIREIIDVHLMGCYFLGQPAFRLMKQQQYGRIVLISSSAGMYGSLWQSNYGAAKAGVVGLMNNLAREGAKHGVRTNCVLPSAFTRLGREANEFPPDFHDQAPEGWEALFDPEISLGYVVPMVTYLASRECQVNQQAYAATGGRFSRVFTAISEGWVSDYRKNATAEEIASHIQQIDRTEKFIVPKVMQEEFADVIRARNAL